MLFFGKRKSAPLVQSSTEDWRKQWQDLVPPECRNVPVTVDGKTMTAYVQINHFVMMLQDGLLMQQGFLNRTPRGRVVTDAAYRHLGLPVPTGE